MEPKLPWYKNQRNTSQEKKNYRSIFFTIIDEDLLKILAIGEIHHHQVEFTLGMLDWINIRKSTNVLIHYTNKLKNKNHIIVSTDVENAFD